MDLSQLVQAYFKRNWIALLIALLVVLGLLAFGSGWRLAPGPRIVRDGTLTVSGLPAGAVVYADATRGGVARVAGDVSLSLIPGTHSVLVDVTGDYPWNDLVTVPAGGTASVTPILVPSRSKVTVYSADDQKKAEALFKAATLPSAASPLVMEHGCALVHVDGNRIVADATTTPGCTPPAYLCSGGSCSGTVVFSPVAPLHSVVPFPGRQDVLVVAYGDMVAVLELDPLAPQYFAPVYKGTAPSVVSWDDRSIAVSDNGSITDIAFR